MTASTPGPDDEPHALSARERAILADIESDLTEADPALAHNFARRLPTTAIRAWPPVTARQLGWLVAALLIITLAAVLLPPAWWALLAVITVILIVPWMLLCAIGRPGLFRRPPGARPGNE